MLRGTLMAVRYIKTQRAGALAIFAKHAKGVAPDVLRGAMDEQADKFLDDGEASLEAWKAELAVRASIVGLKQAPAPQIDVRLCAGQAGGQEARRQRLEGGKVAPFIPPPIAGEGGAASA